MNEDGSDRQEVFTIPGEVTADAEPMADTVTDGGTAQRPHLEAVPDSPVEVVEPSQRVVIGHIAAAGTALDDLRSKLVA